MARTLPVGTAVCFKVRVHVPEMLGGQYGWTVAKPTLVNDIPVCDVRLCDWTLSGIKGAPIVTVPATDYFSVLKPDAAARLAHLYDASFADAAILQRLHDTAREMQSLRQELARGLSVTALPWKRLWEARAGSEFASVAVDRVSPYAMELRRGMIFKAHELAHAHALYVA